MTTASDQNRQKHQTPPATAREEFSMADAAAITGVASNHILNFLKLKKRIDAIIAAMKG
ncbi:MAG: hypothetical protein ABIK98_11580 [Pseudomonadota bacterium]